MGPPVAPDLLRGRGQRGRAEGGPSGKGRHLYHQPGKRPVADLRQRLYLRLRHGSDRRAVLLQKPPVKALQGSDAGAASDQSRGRPDRHSRQQRPDGPLGRVQGHRSGQAPRSLHHPLPAAVFHAGQGKRPDRLQLQASTRCGGSHLPADRGYHDFHEIHRPPEDAGAHLHRLQGLSGPA